MLRSTAALRHAALLLVMLPLTLPQGGCSESTNIDDPDLLIDGGPQADGGTTQDGGFGADAASWSSPDTTPPSVIGSSPVAAATGAPVHGPVTATFSEGMTPLTSATFGLKQGAVVVAGAVTYYNETVSFVPTIGLAPNTVYTATITAAARDLAGNPLVAAHSWSFTTDATLPLGPAPVLLGAAGGYAILAKSAISNVPTSAITGNLGLSPAAASYITGFSLTRAGTKWTSPQVVGNIHAADNDPPTPTDLTTAVSNMQTAYTDAAGRPTPTVLNLGAGTIGGMTLAPGLYKWTSAVTIPTDLTLAGAPNDVWIFQISGNLTLAAAKRMTLSGGAQAKNVFWQVAGLVELGTTSHAEGIMLSMTAIKLGTGASINGRLLAQTAVNISGSTVKVPAL